MEQASVRQFGLALPFFCLLSQDSSDILSAFSVSEEVRLVEKASFLPPLAFLGSIPLPTFYSYCPQTPIQSKLSTKALRTGDRVLKLVCLREKCRDTQYLHEPLCAAIDTKVGQDQWETRK